MSHHLKSSEIQTYLDGELDSHETARTMAHLEVCEKCRDEVESYNMLYMALENQPVAEFSPQFSKNIINSLNTSVEAKSHQKLFDILLALSGIIFSIVITISFAGFNSISLFVSQTDSYGLGLIKEQFSRLFMLSGKIMHPYLFAGLAIIILIFFLEKFLFRKKDLLYSV